MFADLEVDEPFELVARSGRREQDGTAGRHATEQGADRPLDDLNIVEVEEVGFQTEAGNVREIGADAGAAALAANSEPRGAEGQAERARGAHLRRNAGGQLYERRPRGRIVAVTPPPARRPGRRRASTDAVA